MSKAQSDAISRSAALRECSLRPLTRDDFERLVTWINQPHVARWWDGLVDLEAVKAQYEPCLEDDSPTNVYVIQLDQRPIGIIQCYRHRDCPEWDKDVGIDLAAGIDYLIGEPDCIGKGFGVKAINLITQVAFQVYPEIEVIVSVPQRDNRASCRALEKAGFALVEERKLASESPSDAGISSIYALRRVGPDPQLES